MSNYGTRTNAVLIFTIAAILGGALAFLKPANKVERNDPAPAAAAVKKEVSAQVVTPAPATSAVAPKPVQTSFAKPSLDGPIKGLETPAFVELGNGVFQAEAKGYSALLSAADGLRYHPKSAHGQTSELRVSLKSVRRGSFSLFDRASDDAAGTDSAVAKGSGGLSYWRAPSFEECYQPRGDGVEQSFVLDSKPGGEGTLDFVCDVELGGLIPMPKRAARNGGIMFMDTAGNFAVKYGQVMVRDSANHGLPLEPQLAADSKQLSFSVPREWLDKAQYPIVVDPLVGTDFTVSSPANAVGVSQPTVCAGNDNFLVAWDDFTSGANTPQLAGAIVDTKGNIFSNVFAISNLAGAPFAYRSQRIEAAFDGGNWLVVWADYSTDRTVGVYGAIVGGGGTVLGGSDFLIAATVNGQGTEDPLVAFNGTLFVISWKDLPAGQGAGSQIYYKTLSVTNSAVALSATVTVRSIFTPANQQLEYLVSQPTGGDTLLMYSELTETPAAHRTIRIAADGTNKDVLGSIGLFNENIDESGFGRPIGAVFTNGEWEILSSYNQLADSSIFLHHLSLDGKVTPPNGVFAVMGLGPTGLQTQDGQFLDAFAPAFPGASEWLFLRNERTTVGSKSIYHLLGKRVTFAGVDMDPVPFQIDTNNSNGIIRSAVAAQSGGSFLAAWVDGRGSAFTPPDAAQIAAALIDATASNPVDIALIAVAGASPTSGEAPLTVAFDLSGSKGAYDTFRWDFGDGTLSTSLIAPSHVYKNNGTYIAQLKLTKGAYSVFDSVVINVGTGGAKIQIGSPLVNTAPIVTGLFIGGVVVKLDLLNLSDDQATVTGIFDITSLPAPITGRPASISIGGVTFTFNLDSSGAFKSDAGTFPAMQFAIDPVKGGFVFQLADASLKVPLAQLGLINDNVTPAQIVEIPIALGIGSVSANANAVSATSSIGLSYHAVKNVKGTANYGFLGVGTEVSGSFLVTTCNVNENADKTHNFTIKGRLVRPGIYKPAQVGNFNIYVGDYTVAFQSGAIFNKGGTLTYKQSQVKNGLKQFTIDLNSGVFTIQMLRIPADSTIGGSGMPLAKSGTDVTMADVNLSFSFDLFDGSVLTAGRYLYIGRPLTTGKAWKLR